MPAVSKQQQKFMGMVHAIHKGELEPSEVSPEMRKASVSLKKKTAKDFASTKHKGLPVKVPKKKKKTEAIQPSTDTGYTKDGVVQFTGSKKVALQKMKADKKKNPSSKYQLVDTISKKVGDKIKTEGCKKMKKMNEGEDKALVKQGLKYAKKKYKYDANDLKHLAKELLVYMRSGEISDQASMEAYLDYRHDPKWDEGVNPIKEAIRPIVREILNEAMTADENYKDKVKQISNAMKLIKFKIAKHNSQQKGDPKNWGFAGDLGYVIEQMQDIISFLSKKK